VPAAEGRPEGLRYARLPSAQNRFVERIPLIRGGDARADLVDHRTAGVAVGHDRDAVALRPMNLEILDDRDVSMRAIIAAGEESSAARTIVSADSTATSTNRFTGAILSNIRAGFAV
jgi:hypothetical protein